MADILFKALISQSSPNILIYPDRGVGILYETLNKLHEINENIIITEEGITYIKNNVYYEFNLKEIINRDINHFIGILKNIIISKNYYSKFIYKIIIFKNFNCIRNTLQNILRVIIEKYRETTIFICCTDKFNSVIEPLRSRFLCIRFPPISNKTKRKIIYDNSDKKFKSPKFYDFIYDIEGKTNIYPVLDKESVIQKYEDPYKIITIQIIKLYIKKKLNKGDYENLKNIAYNIFKYNIDISRFYFIFLSELLNFRTIRDKTKCELILLFAQSEYDLKRSYRSIIILESLLINTRCLLRFDLMSLN